MGLSLRIPLQPIPVPRMRVTARGGRPRAYPDPKYSTWLRDAGALFDELTPKGWSPSDALLLCEVNMFCQKPKTGKLLTPRGDLDNLVKGPMDAATGRVWVDDDQVVDLKCTKEYVPHGTDGFFLMTVSEIFDT